jgi:hypothetical protein
VCRTAALGGHVYRCKDCVCEHFAPHSCRNRHCPACQPMLGYDWMQRQSDALLAVPYFHLVFTLPHELNALIARNQAALYKLLFDAASATLLEFGRNRFKAQIGITAVLHTWSQTLLDHYHLHCIVTGGGLKLDGSGWAHCPKGWIFPVKALGKVFRGKYRAGLRQLCDAGKLQFFGQLEGLEKPQRFRSLLAKACRQPWVVYAKAPFEGPAQVIGYLARYTHRVGITNARVRKLDLAAGTVTFAYKDRSQDDAPRQMQVDIDEFVRRLRLHILPPGFVKIRHYGLLSNRNRTEQVPRARALLSVEPAVNPKPLAEPRSPSPQRCCPQCRSVRLHLVRVVLPQWSNSRAPP